MIGGRFGTVSGVALIAAAGLLSGSIAAQAADLGGNCCADLEERVAELEATTARKGNRKVSLTISGHVNEAVLFWDDGINSGARIVTNGFSMTRFRFLGSAQINADWSAGFLIELGLGRTGMSYDVDQKSGARGGGYGLGGDDKEHGPGIRHQALWIKSKSLGTLWLGHTTDAIDGMIDICLGCPITSSSESGLGWGDLVTADSVGGAHYTGVTLSQLGIGQEGYYATRTNLIKYVSPTFAGFSLSASWGDTDDGDASEFTTGREHGYDWDVALRYAGEFGAIRVAAGAGYGEINAFSPNTTGDSESYGSYVLVASLQHVPTGLYIHGNYREQDIVDCHDWHNCTDKSWAVQVGIAQKWSSLGKTTFWAQYQEYDNGFRRGIDHFDGPHVHGTEAQIISGGINQKIDAAAMELYVTYWNITGDVDSHGNNVNWELEDINVVMAGARIQF